MSPQQKGLALKIWVLVADHSADWISDIPYSASADLERQNDRVQSGSLVCVLWSLSRKFGSILEREISVCEVCRTLNFVVYYLSSECESQSGWKIRILVQSSGLQSTACDIQLTSELWWLSCLETRTFSFSEVDLLKGTEITGWFSLAGVAKEALHTKMQLTSTALWWRCVSARLTPYSSTVFRPVITLCITMSYCMKFYSIEVCDYVVYHHVLLYKVLQYSGLWLRCVSPCLTLYRSTFCPQTFSYLV
jgi:hypothetical protein